MDSQHLTVMAPEPPPTGEDYLVWLNHELRTPLNAILGFSNLLASAEGLNERQRRYAANIQASGHRLLCLIRNVMAAVRPDPPGPSRSASEGPGAWGIEP
jgi:signal transduction histidine kinase